MTPEIEAFVRELITETDKETDVPYCRAWAKTFIVMHQFEAADAAGCTT